MICERCAEMPVCPPEVQNAYGRDCWLAFGADAPEPDCARFVARNERYWRGADEWRSGRRVRPVARTSYGQRRARE